MISFTRAATRLRSTTINDHGIARTSWASSTSATVYGAYVPATTADELTNRNGVEVTGTFYAKSGSDIASNDRLVIDGQTFEVVGKPLPFRSPTGALNHLVVSLSIWEG